MNANLNTTSYRMHELTRDSAMQAADAHRLARKTAGDTAGITMQRTAQLMAVIVTITVMALLAAAPASAQRDIEPGRFGPQHPVLVRMTESMFSQTASAPAEDFAKPFRPHCVKNAPACRPPMPTELDSYTGRPPWIIEKYLDSRFWLL